MGNKKNSLTPSGGNVALPELLTHRPPRWGLHSLGVKKEKVYYRAISAGFERGASGPKPLTVTPEPIALATYICMYLSLTCLEQTNNTYI